MSKAKATDILALIEAEHRQVEELFQKIEKAKGNNISQYFKEIYKALNLHAKSEELTFYPALREYEQTAQYIEEAEEEHEEVSAMLEEIKALQPNDPEFLDKIRELQAEVEHHVEEEETEIFSAVRECMSEEQLTQLGQEFQTAKAKLVANVEAALA